MDDTGWQEDKWTTGTINNPIELLLGLQRGAGVGWDGETESCVGSLTWSIKILNKSYLSPRTKEVCLLNDVQLKLKCQSYIKCYVSVNIEVRNGSWFTFRSKDHLCQQDACHRLLPHH